MSDLIKALTFGALATSALAFAEERINNPQSDRLLAELNGFHLLFGGMLTLLTLPKSN